MDSLQEPSYNHPPPARRPSPYETKPARVQNPYDPRPLPPDPPLEQRQKPQQIGDPYASAFELLQGIRSNLFADTNFVQERAELP
jgi:hypothetical protein